jgi:hypothetical protein
MSAAASAAAWMDRLIMSFTLPEIVGGGALRINMSFGCAGKEGHSTFSVPHDILMPECLPYPRARP